jgi:hypothetical protein
MGNDTPQMTEKMNFLLDLAYIKNKYELAAIEFVTF